MRPAPTSIHAINSTWGAAVETVFVVQVFKMSGYGPQARGTILCGSEVDARRRAAGLAANALGVLAYKQDGDFDLGEYSEPQEIVRHGVVPDFAMGEDW